MTDAEGGRWDALRKDVEKARDGSPPTADKVRNQILFRLKRLTSGERPRCSATVQGWLVSEKAGRLVEITVAKSADAKDSWQNPAVLLKNLHYHDCVTAPRL